MIFGERIRFRGIEREDLPTFVKWINDPDVLQGIGIYLPYAMADEEDWFEKMRSRTPEEHNLAIEARLPSERTSIPSEGAGLSSEQTAEKSLEQDAESWKLIGSCGFFNLDHRNSCCEFGIMIGEKTYWNRGYGTEAVRLLVQHGFTILNLNRIYLRVLETNLRAIRAYEKAGFTHEGRQRQADFKDGKYLDLLVMSMLRSEF